MINKNATLHRRNDQARLNAELSKLTKKIGQTLRKHMTRDDYANIYLRIDHNEVLRVNGQLKLFQGYVTNRCRGRIASYTVASGEWNGPVKKYTVRRLR
jgi:hypothetical protein